MRKKLKILFIEDDEIEVMKLTRAVSTLKVNHHFHKATDGEEAMMLLNKKECYPDVILLDLNMPKMNGLDFLKSLKQDEYFRYIPIIILTTSNNHKDVRECYENGIAGYIIKPLKYEDYVEKLRSLLDYWSVNELIRPK